MLTHLAAQTPANRALATFPAQQRPPGDPALVERGKTLYSISCQGCHGADLRGGDLGGPNLLRSQVVLSDQDGELILPIIQGARQSTGMPAVSMNATDVKATATYLHSVVATAKGQGAPPDIGIAPATILVGDATAGQ
jgi:cytochrome c oxidase cbb3-type subunit 3